MSDYFKKTIPALLFVIIFVAVKIITFDHTPFDEITPSDIQHL